MNNSATPLERPKQLEGRSSLTDEEVAELAKRAARLLRNNSDAAPGDSLFLAALADVDRYKNPNATGGLEAQPDREFDKRTSLIVDPASGRIPQLTADGRARIANAPSVNGGGPRPPGGPEDFSNALRCISADVPRLGGNAASYNSYYQIVQSPGYVLFFSEMIHDARIIPVGQRAHLPEHIGQWHGDSVGRWEGDTLVVDTINFSPKSNFMGSAEHLHLIERFTRVAPDTLEYKMTFNDPTTWAASWTAVVRLKQSQDKVFEYACHEGNFDVMRGMLEGARRQEKTAAEAARTQK